MFRWWKEKRKLALLTIIGFLCFLWFYEESGHFKSHGFIHSAYYFPDSRGLDKNSIAIVMTIDKNYLWDYQDIRLITSNSLEKSISRVKISIESDGNTDEDFVTALIQSVSLSDEKLAKLEKLELRSNGEVFEIPFRTIRPHTTTTPKLPVVLCYAPPNPPFISENWQDFLLQTRISSHFWAHYHYYISLITLPLYQLQSSLSTDNSVSIQPWSRHEKSSNGAVFTDCLLQYKEKTDFMVFLDSDDLLTPSGADSYYEEFLRLFNGHPLVSSLRYSPYQLDINYDYHGSWDNYSIPRSLINSKSTKLTKSTDNQGVLVIRTEMFNSSGSLYSENANTRWNSRITKIVAQRCYKLNPVETRSDMKFQLIRPYQLDGIQRKWERLKIPAGIQKILPTRRFFRGNTISPRSQPDDLQCLSAATVIQSISDKRHLTFHFATAPPILVPATDCW